MTRIGQKKKKKNGSQIKQVVVFWTTVGALLCLRMSRHGEAYVGFYTAYATGSATEKTLTPTSSDNHQVVATPLTRNSNSIINRSINITPNPSADLQLENNLAAIVLSRHEREIAFVHVGKAGGNTIRSALPRLRCSRFKTFQQQTRCFQNHNRSDSLLARSCHAEIHINKGPQTVEALENTTTFLVSLRNPIVRAISAYQYLHHNNTKSVYAQSAHPDKEKFYKICFPTLKELMWTLHQIQYIATASMTKATATNNSTRQEQPKHLYYSDCQRMAVQVLKGRAEVVKYINIHLRDNYQYYKEHSMDLCPSCEVLVVRTEQLWGDLIALDVTLGGSGVFTTEGKVANENKITSTSITTVPGGRHGKKSSGSNQRAYNKIIDNESTSAVATASVDTAGETTTQQLHILCCILWKELETYQDILNGAVNLNYESKLESLHDVWSSCSITNDDGVQFSAPVPTLENGINARILDFSWSKWNKQSCPDLSQLLPEQ